MGGVGSYQSWTCTEDDSPMFTGAFTAPLTTKQWEFTNRCTGDPDRITQIRVGFADGFAIDETTGAGVQCDIGATLHAPVWIEMQTESLTIFQKPPHFNSPFTF